MNKLLLIGSLALCAAVNATALDLSAGLGVNGSFVETTTDAGGSSSSSVERVSYFGALGFFDAKYLVAEAGARWMYADDRKDGSAVKAPRTALEFSLLGKYPVRVADALTLFPIGGIEYAVNAGSFDADLSQFWLKGGVGVDVNFPGPLYLRSTAMYGYKLRSEYENDLIDDYEDLNGGGASIDTAKLEIGLAVGYRF